MMCGNLIRLCAPLCGIACVMAVLMTGCKTQRIRPETLPVTERDNEVYKSPLPPTPIRERKSVAVMVAKSNTFYGDVMEKTLDTSLVEKISALQFFRLAERSNIDVFRVDDLLLGLENDDVDNILPSDNLISARVTFVDGSGRNVDVYADQKEQQQEAEEQAQELATGRKAVAKRKPQSGNWMDRMIDSLSLSATVDIRFYEKETRSTILTKSYTYDFSRITGGSRQSWFIDSARDAANRFARALGKHFAPPARVLQTRGSGRMARISIGRNYGLVNGMEVYFYEIIDNSGIIADSSFDRNVIGRGQVIEVGERYAWADVYNFQGAHVRRGVYVDISPEEEASDDTNMKVR